MRPKLGCGAVAVIISGATLHRSWGISRSHTASQMDAFQAQLRDMAGLLAQHGGPFLLGTDVSLVSFVATVFLSSCVSYLRHCHVSTEARMFMIYAVGILSSCDTSQCLPAG